LDIISKEGRGTKNEIGGHVEGIEENRVVYRVLVGKPEGKRPLGRSRRRWENNIKMYLQDVGAWAGSIRPE
jgi:hypothetical protein